MEYEPSAAALIEALRGLPMPVARALEELREAALAPRLVVEAAPGAGKTTIVPAVLAAVCAGEGQAGRVVCTQPRRVAARAAARHLARLLGEDVGGRVGYSVRGESRVGPGCLIEFVTAGVAVRRMIADPLLEGTSALIIDEVHERSVESDLALAFGLEAADATGMRLVAMSATLDAQAFADLLGARTWRAEARAHPLTIAWEPPPRGIDALTPRGVDRGFLDHVARVAAREAARGEGDVLVFVPGVGEVEAVAGRVRALAGIDVYPLHGRLDARAQDRALTPGPVTRVIVSTSLAESSVTVPGVRCVVDSGLARQPRYNVARGMGGLQTVTETKAAATQRAGRAAREGAGRAIRCFAQSQWARMDRDTPSALATSDLTSTALDLAAWGAPGGQGLRMIERPPAAAMARAEATLRGLGALDQTGQVTPIGRRMARIPADPRLARALLEGADRVGARAAGEIVAALAEDVRPAGGDLVAALASLRRGDRHGPWRAQAARLAALAGAAGVDAPDLTGDDALAWIVALAYPERIARRRGSPGQGARTVAFHLASGTGAAIDAASPIAAAEWLAISDVSESGAGGPSGALIRAGVPLDPDLAREAGRHLIGTRVETRIEGGRASASRVTSLGSLTLTREPTRPDAASVRACVARMLDEDGLACVPFSEAAETLRARLDLLHTHVGAPWPDASRDALTASALDWLAPAWTALEHGRPLTAGLVLDCLRGLLPWPEAARLDELAPCRLTLPSGRAAAVTYGEAGPVLAAKLQECFGWSENPTVAGGRVRVIVDLLDPAGRVLAHSGDLAYFWSEVYPQVRAEMRGRYPKHPWPQDPSTATPTARTNRSRRP